MLLSCIPVFLLVQLEIKKHSCLECQPVNSVTTSCVTFLRARVCIYIHTYMHIRNVCTRSSWSSWCGSHYVKVCVCMCVSVSIRLCTSIRENENTQDLALTGLVKTSPQNPLTIGIGKYGYSELRSSYFRQVEMYTK